MCAIVPWGYFGRFFLWCFRIFCIHMPLSTALGKIIILLSCQRLCIIWKLYSLQGMFIYYTVDCFSKSFVHSLVKTNISNLKIIVVQDVLLVTFLVDTCGFIGLWFNSRYGIIGCYTFVICILLVVTNPTTNAVIVALNMCGSSRLPFSY